MIAAYFRRTAPFSPLRFRLYLASLACISLYSLFSAPLAALLFPHHPLNPERLAQVSRALDQASAQAVTMQAPAPTQTAQARALGMDPQLVQAQMKVADARIERAMMMKAMLEQAGLDQAKHPEMSLDELLKQMAPAAPYVKAQAKVRLAEREYELAMRSIQPEIPAPREVETPKDPAETQYAILRLGRPADEIRRQLRLVGLPSFLQGLAATGQFDDSGDITIDVAVQGKNLGRYIERLVPIDADRSKLSITFVPADAALLAQFVASIKTVHDPATLMRVVMMEHTRATLAGEDFNLRVLEGAPNSPGASFLERVSNLGICPAPETDDFPLCDRDRDAAIFRHANRAKAKM